MSAEGFLDTNILIYATLAADPRADRAVELLASGGVISVQVLNEFASIASRKLGRSWPEIRAVLADLRALCSRIQPLGVGTHESALELVERYRLSFYDALIVAAAVEAGCSTLWSEDMQHGQVFEERLTVQNPFLGR